MGWCTESCSTIHEFQGILMMSTLVLRILCELVSDWDYDMDIIFISIDDSAYVISAVVFVVKRYYLSSERSGVFCLGKTGVDFKNIDFMKCDDPCFRACTVIHGFITKSMFCSMYKHLKQGYLQIAKHGS